MTLLNHINALVIGYGNSLRGDDAVGWRVAEAIDALQLPRVVTYTRHQLTPELAASLAETPRAVFVDACVDPTLASVRVRRVEPDNQLTGATHHVTAECLLGLTKALYDASPETWAVDIPASEFEFGERLSDRTSKALLEAVARIREIVG